MTGVHGNIITHLEGIASVFDFSFVGKNERIAGINSEQCNVFFDIKFLCSKLLYLRKSKQTNAFLCQVNLFQNLVLCKEELYSCVE